MGTESIKVLIADDSSLMLKSIAKLVTDAGYEVIATAENGKNAVAQAIAKKPQMVLLDVNMPIANGIYALEHISALFPGIVVIMMTSDSDPAIVDKCMELGAAGYILKSDAKEDILSTIKECWETNATT